MDNFIKFVDELPHKLLSKIVFWFIVLLTVYLFAVITWKLVPNSKSAFVWTPPVISGEVEQNLDLNKFRELSLFGIPLPVEKKTKAQLEAEKAAKEAALAIAKDDILNAPKTKLTIKLTGVVASSIQKKGLAVIQSGEFEDTYSLGDKIKKTNASLYEVYVDRIIIQNNGKYETLPLDGLTFSSKEVSVTSNTRESNAKKVNQVGEDDYIAENIEQLRELIAEKPQKLLDYIAFSPELDLSTEELLGYRLNAGKNPQLFQKLGFRNGDIAIQINEYDLTKKDQAMIFLTESKNLATFTVKFLRRGKQRTIEIGR